MINEKNQFVVDIHPIKLREIVNNYFSDKADQFQIGIHNATQDAMITLTIFVDVSVKIKTTNITSMDDDDFFNEIPKIQKKFQKGTNGSQISSPYLSVIFCYGYAQGILANSVLSKN